SGNEGKAEHGKEDDRDADKASHQCLRTIAICAVAVVRKNSLLFIIPWDTCGPHSHGRSGSRPGSSTFVHPVGPPLYHERLPAGSLFRATGGRSAPPRRRGS